MLGPRGPAGRDGRDGAAGRDGAPGADGAYIVQGEIKYENDDPVRGRIVQMRSQMSDGTSRTVNVYRDKNDRPQYIR